MRNGGYRLMLKRQGPQGFSHCRVVCGRCCWTVRSGRVASGLCSFLGFAVSGHPVPHMSTGMNAGCRASVSTAPTAIR